MKKLYDPFSLLLRARDLSVESVVLLASKFACTYSFQMHSLFFASFIFLFLFALLLAIKISLCYSCFSSRQNRLSLVPFHFPSSYFDIYFQLCFNLRSMPVACMLFSVSRAYKHDDYSDFQVLQCAVLDFSILFKTTWSVSSRRVQLRLNHWVLSCR